MTLLEIVEFLTARLDEDETVAQIAREPLVGGYPDYRTYDDDSTRAADGFLDHFNPERALAEVEAKRQIVAGYLARVEQDHPAVQAHATGLLLALRLLALPYADHEDFREEWRP